jgi:hypothetical protein
VPFQGGVKLKIPTLLLSEKEKTRNRFAQVRSLSESGAPSGIYVLTEQRSQMKKREGCCIEGSQDTNTDGCCSLEEGRQEAGICPSVAGIGRTSTEEEDMVTECTSHSSRRKEYCIGGPTATDSAAPSTSLLAAAMSLKMRSQHPAPESRTSSVCSSTATATGFNGTSPALPLQGASNKSLYRRVRNSIMSMVVPLGRRRRKGLCSSDGKPLLPHAQRQQQQQQHRHHDPAQAHQDSFLPKKTVFVFTEEDSLRRIVKRILKDCPRMARSSDREGFLVKLIEMMDEETAPG